MDNIDLQRLHPYHVAIYLANNGWEKRYFNLPDHTIWTHPDVFYDLIQPDCPIDRHYVDFLQKLIDAVSDFEKRSFADVYYDMVIHVRNAKEKALTVTSSQVEKYLAEHGWQVEAPTKYFIRWTRPVGADSEPVEIVQSLLHEHFITMFWDMLINLSKFEKRSPVDIYYDIVKIPLNRKEPDGS